MKANTHFRTLSNNNVLISSFLLSCYLKNNILEVEYYILVRNSLFFHPENLLFFPSKTFIAYFQSFLEVLCYSLLLIKCSYLSHTMDLKGQRASPTTLWSSTASAQWWYTGEVPIFFLFAESNYWFEKGSSMWRASVCEYVFVEEMASSWLQNSISNKTFGWDNYLVFTWQVSHWISKRG